MGTASLGLESEVVVCTLKQGRQIYFISRRQKDLLQAQMVSEMHNGTALMPVNEM